MSTKNFKSRSYTVGCQQLPVEVEFAAQIALGAMVLVAVIGQLGYQSPRSTKAIADSFGSEVESISLMERLQQSIRIPRPKAKNSAPTATLVATQSDFSSPDGLAPTPNGDGMYVSQENSGTVLLLRNGQQQVVVDAATPMSGRQNPLRSPEGLAVTADSELLVCEDIPGGRLISYDLDERGQATEGRVIDLPAEDHPYAWESVAATPNGGILLTGSSLEQALQQDGPAPFDSVILYRDEDGAWWEVARQAMASYSSVSVNDAGTCALYTCELTGELGMFDLTKRERHAKVSEHRFESPEGTCFLPDGNCVVAEETGRLVYLDLARDEVAILADDLASIESVCLVEGQLHVTADGNGSVLTFDLDQLEQPRTATPQAPQVTFDAGDYPYVPESCPSYLDGVLSMAGMTPEERTGNSFYKLARNVSLIAVDAKATLLRSDCVETDAIQEIQFAIFNPGQIGFMGGGLTGPVSGFAAKHASGELVETVTESREALHIDLLAAQISPMPGMDIAIPYPGPTKLVNGSAFITFMGLGRTPDYCITLNPHDPEQNRMTVMHTDGAVDHYALTWSEAEENPDWVIALRSWEADSWEQLTQAETVIQLADVR